MRIDFNTPALFRSLCNPIGKFSYTNTQAGGYLF